LEKWGRQEETGVEGRSANDDEDKVSPITTPPSPYTDRHHTVNISIPAQPNQTSSLYCPTPSSVSLETQDHLLKMTWRISEVVSLQFAIELEGVVMPVLQDDDYDRLGAQAPGAGKLFPGANLVPQTSYNLVPVECVPRCAPC
jgi:hypothetical protein